MEKILNVMMKSTKSDNFRDFINHATIVDLETRQRLFSSMCENQGQPDANKTIYLISGGIASGKSIIAYHLIKSLELAHLPYVSSDTYYKKYFYCDQSFEEGYDKARAHTDKMLFQFLQSDASFVWETVLSKKKKETFLSNCVKEGYKIYTVFVGVEDCNISCKRSDERAQGDYHHIEYEFIKDRYEKSMQSLKWIHKLSDIFIAVDNTENPQVIYLKENGKVVTSNENNGWFNKYIKG